MIHIIDVQPDADGNWIDVEFSTGSRWRLSATFIRDAISQKIQNVIPLIPVPLLGGAVERLDLVAGKDAEKV